MPTPLLSEVLPACYLYCIPVAGIHALAGVPEVAEVLAVAGWRLALAGISADAGIPSGAAIINFNFESIPADA